MPDGQSTIAEELQVCTLVLGVDRNMWGAPTGDTDGGNTGKFSDERPEGERNRQDSPVNVNRPFQCPTLSGSGDAENAFEMGLGRVHNPGNLGHRPNEEFLHQSSLVAGG